MKISHIFQTLLMVAAALAVAFGSNAVFNLGYFWLIIVLVFCYLILTACMVSDDSHDRIMEETDTYPHWFKILARTVDATVIVLMAGSGHLWIAGFWAFSVLIWIGLRSNWKDSQDRKAELERLAENLRIKTMFDDVPEWMRDK